MYPRPSYLSSWTFYACVSLVSSVIPMHEIVAQFWCFFNAIFSIGTSQTVFPRWKGARSKYWKVQHFAKTTFYMHGTTYYELCTRSSQREAFGLGEFRTGTADCYYCIAPQKMPLLLLPLLHRGHWAEGSGAAPITFWIFRAWQWRWVLRSLPLSFSIQNLKHLQS